MCPNRDFFGLQMYHLAVLDAMTAYKTQTWQMVESHRLSMVQAFEFWSISFGSLACIHLLIILPCGGHFFSFEIGKKETFMHLFFLGKHFATFFLEDKPLTLKYFF
jgi:hypothetical protein